MGFLFKAALYIVVLLLAVTAVAYTFARKDDTGRKVEEFVSGREPKYDIGGTVALVSAYKQVYGEQPDPSRVREAYDDMASMKLHVDKTSAVRYFKERKRLSPGAPGLPPGFPGDAGHDGAGEGPGEGGAGEGPGEGGAGEGPGEGGDGEWPDDGFASDDDAGQSGEADTERAGSDEEGNGAPEEAARRSDPFLVSVSAELAALRSRIDALSSRVRMKADGASPFSPSALTAVRGRDLSSAATRGGGTRPAPARLSGEESSLRLTRRGRLDGPDPSEDVVEGFYSPW